MGSSGQGNGISLRLRSLRHRGSAQWRILAPPPSWALGPKYAAWGNIPFSCPLKQSNFEKISHNAPVAKGRRTFRMQLSGGRRTSPGGPEQKKSPPTPCSLFSCHGGASEGVMYAYPENNPICNCQMWVLCSCLSPLALCLSLSAEYFHGAGGLNSGHISLR